MIWNGIYRRSFVLENGIVFNETAGAAYQDNGFYMQTMAFATRFYILRKAFYCLRRDNPNSSIYRKDTRYAMIEEMDFVHRQLIKRPELYDRIKSVFFRNQFWNFNFELNRLADECKEDYIKKNSEIFNKYMNSGEADISALNDRDKESFLKVCKDPEGYYADYLNRDKETEEKNFILKLKKCYKDNGLKYTVKRILFHLYLGRDNDIERTNRTSSKEQ